jgi:hypothetical protein
MPTALRAFAWISWVSAAMVLAFALYDWGSLPPRLTAAERTIASQAIGALIGTAVSLLILGTLLRAGAETLDLLRRAVRALDYAASRPPRHGGG